MTTSFNLRYVLLELYGIKNNNLKWFESYLQSRQQYIKYDKQNTEMANIICGVPQGSILGPLLFLIYVNDLFKSSEILNPTMFADDTNLFFSNKNIPTLFKTVNEELTHVNEWFKVNKLSLNSSKTKYTFFNKPKISDDIPLKLPMLYINGSEIKREYQLKFLGVILDENMTWKKHIELIENKISKNIGIMYKVKLLLNQNCLKIYIFLIYS